MRAERPGRAPRRYRALLRLLPGELRRRHGGEMEELFLDALERARAGRPGAVPLTWAVAAWDVVRRSAYERGRRLRHWRPLRRETMSTLASEVRLAARGLARQPGITVLVTVMLALGIAAGTTVFTLIDGLFLRPLPWPEPERLVYLNETSPRLNLEFTGTNYPDFHTWRESNRTFEGMALYGVEGLNFSDGRSAERLEGAVITHDFLGVLGVRPVLGRGFTPEEDRPGGAPVALLSYDFWRTRYGGDAGVLGRAVRLNGVLHTIVGVLPPEAAFPDRVQLWIPLAGDPAQPYQNYNWDGIGRLRPGVTLEEAKADLLRAHRAVWERSDREHLVSPRVQPLREHYVGSFRALAAALAGGVAIVLLIACANVASVMLARAAGRRREVGVRMALGAGAGRLVRQFLVETLALSVVGGALGLLLGAWGVRLLVASFPEQAPAWIRFDLGARAVGFSIAATLATALLAGIAPALQAITGNVRSALAADGGRSSTATPGQRRTLNLLVIAEIALASVLLVGGGLLLRAYQRLERVDPGFRPENVLTFRLILPESKYPGMQAQAAFYERLIERLRALPGVEEAAAVSCPPLTCHWGRTITAEGAPPRRPGEENPIVLFRVATSDYAAAMGLRMLRGHFFDEREGSADAPLVAVVNDVLVRRFFPPGTDPIGKRFRNDSNDSTWITIVGVTSDVKHYGLDQPMRPGVYLPLAQQPLPSLAIVVHARTEPTALIAPAREVVRELDPELPLADAGTMQDLLDRSLALRRTYSWMLGVFACVALALAVGGIYGVLSYVVGQRTREIGIRLALGAPRARVLRLVLGQGLALAAAGVACGLALSLAAARALASLLYGVAARDPATYALVAVLLGATALAAAFGPARRAVAVDPNSVLRE